MTERGWIEVLPTDVCERLLARREVGRVAVIVDGHPEVFPVNYRWDGEAVLFRTDDGTKLHSSVTWPSVAFEVDEFDRTSHTGWSVLVVGHAEEVPDWKLTVQPEPWSTGSKPHLVRVAPTKITGRRLPLPLVNAVDASLAADGG